MEVKGSKKVEGAGLNGKLQFNIKKLTNKCDISIIMAYYHTPTHLSNENTLLKHIDKVIHPYAEKKRKELHLDCDFPALFSLVWSF